LGKADRAGEGNRRSFWAPVKIGCRFSQLEIFHCPKMKDSLAEESGKAAIG